MINTVLKEIIYFKLELTHFDHDFMLKAERRGMCDVCIL
jgi:hypothetical protein